MSATASPGYRADIDGLRAVAVLLVLGYHLDVGLPGGFVGVDVFFVISGYLITRQIVSEYDETGVFSLAGFYKRRARRILPALFVTLALTGFASFLILSPDALAEMGGSMVAAVASVANVFFWTKSGYFDAEDAGRPLLHTWSLGVEEQFYVLWPLLIVVLMKRSRRVACLGVGAIVAFSLLSSEALVRGAVGAFAYVPGAYRLLDNPASAAFFLTPFRMWELGAGALLVWAPAPRKTGRAVDEWMLFAGLLAIGGAGRQFTSDTDFPGLRAAIPVIGAMLVIWGGPSRWLGRALRSGPAVSIGKASYSIYLLHWPLLCLAEQFVFDELSATQRLLIGILALVGGFASWRWVEEPWRRAPLSRMPIIRLALLGTATAGALALSGFVARKGEGLAWRIPERRQGMAPDAWHAAEWPFCRAFRPGFDRTLVACQNDRRVEPSIFLWGDSHALHLVPGMSTVFPDHNVFALYKPGCLAANGLGLEDRVNSRAETETCRQHNRAALRFLQQQPPSIVVLSASKRGAASRVAAATLALRATLREAGHTVIVLGDFIRPGKVLPQCRRVPDWLIDDARVSTRCAPRASFFEREMRYSDAFLAGIPERSTSVPRSAPAASVASSTRTARPCSGTPIT